MNVKVRPPLVPNVKELEKELHIVNVQADGSNKPIKLVLDVTTNVNNVAKTKRTVPVVQKNPTELEKTVYVKKELMMPKKETVNHVKNTVLNVLTELVVINVLNQELDKTVNVQRITIFLLDNVNHVKKLAKLAKIKTLVLLVHP